MQDASPTGSTAVALVDAIEAALAGGPPVAVATVVTGGAAGLAAGAKLLVRADGRTLGSLGSPEADEPLREIAIAAFTVMPRIVTGTWYLAGGAATDRPSQAVEGAAEVMLQLFEAPARLVIVGAGHVGLALATMAELLGYETTVLDDRVEFANRERFPMAHRILVEEVGSALDSLAIDTSTAVVLVSRGHRVDEEALRHAVGRGAGYVGMIGSRRRTRTVLDHLAAEGYPAAALEAVSTPVGLDIGAETPEEIAVSILAEMTMVRRGGTGTRMSQNRSADSPT
ncbi:MAG: xanthine dehydrogenase [Chloroflexi bacterium]|nr:MAG: xanthine dehydrogenase [Chloroflexota bacterium]